MDKGEGSSTHTDSQLISFLAKISDFHALLTSGDEQIALLLFLIEKGGKWAQNIQREDLITPILKKGGAWAC